MPQPRKGAGKAPVQPKTFTSTEAASEAADAEVDAERDERDEQLRQHLAQLGELLATGLVLTPNRVQEAFDDAVKRGRLIRQDAEDLARALVMLGRQQAEELLAPLEQLTKPPATRSRAGRAADAAKDAATKGSDVAKGAATKAGEKVGVLPSQPFPGYDGMPAAEVVKRVGGLTPAQLRKLRDREAAGPARKTVLRAVDRQLSS